MANWNQQLYEQYQVILAERDEAVELADNAYRRGFTAGVVTFAVLGFIFCLLLTFIC